MRAVRSIVNWWRDGAEGWNRFWFMPSAPHSLCLIRILTGLLLVYTHVIWALDLDSFLGPHSWIAPDVAREAADGTFTWSHLWYIESMPLLWTVHIAAIGVFVLLTVGLFTRVVSVVAWLLAVAYCHRLNGALFGLDQVTSMLTMYLMIGPSGAVYSLDAWLARRRNPLRLADVSTSANVAIRLLQLHMCIIYLFGGIGKMRGETWWLGDAFWLSIANYEYQSMNMTWMVRYPLLTALITHLTVFWETFYCVLIWPRWTRPLMLAMAVIVHGGIALFLGMPTFGAAMLIGNLAFISPSTIDRMVRIGVAGRSPTESKPAAQPAKGRAGVHRSEAKSLAATPR